MALANTTLSSACALLDKQIVVASATSVAPSVNITVDGETMQVTKGYVSGTTIPVLRAQDGSAQVAHATGAQVSFYVTGADQLPIGPQLSVSTPLAGRGRYPSSVTTSAAWLPRLDNQDEVVEINGTSVVALTLTNPLRSQSGKVVIFVGNGIAAHTLTYTTVGFGNVGATADVVTFGASQAQSFMMIAAGGFWVILGALSTATANVSGPAVA